MPAGGERGLPIEERRDVAAWLKGLGLERYEQAFRDNDIEREVLPRLTAEDLTGLGVTSIGHRRKLLAAVALLSGDVSPVQPPPPEQRPAAAVLSEAERRRLTVLFCDLVGSAALASSLDPEEMRELIRAYQDGVTGETARWDGHVAKFMGDGVLAYFGWPQAHEDAAERAVRAGLEAVRLVSKLRTPAGDALAARIGIATGLVVVGDLIGEGSAREELIVDRAGVRLRPPRPARGPAQPEFDAALRVLEESSLVVRRGEPLAAVYGFKHALVRNAAYESLLRSRQQVLHRRLVAAIEGEFRTFPRYSLSCWRTTVPAPACPRRRSPTGVWPASKRCAVLQAHHAALADAVAARPVCGCRGAHRGGHVALRRGAPCPALLPLSRA